MEAELSFEPIILPDDDQDERGLLVKQGGRLFAVLSFLDQDDYGVNRGQWYLECGFGPLSGTQRTFADQNEAREWILGQITRNRHSDRA